MQEDSSESKRCSMIFSDLMQKQVPGLRNATNGVSFPLQGQHQENTTLLGRDPERLRRVLLWPLLNLIPTLI